MELTAPSSTLRSCILRHYCDLRVTTNFGTNVHNVETGVTFDIWDSDDDILIQAEPMANNEQVEDEENDAAVEINGFNFDEEMEDEEANISIGLGSNAIGTAVHYDCEKSGFDFSAGKLWIYPTNYPIRDYQYNIVQQALYKNTLVVLPTGLGKTFIAAVVMYNFFRWFPQGKIVFMAPTKPLVAQQIQACYNIMGIPKADTVEMTGTMPPAVRQKAWREKRVVFLTPQVISNDLSRGSLSADSIKCLVLDEAHKALGNHAYCQVVRELVKFTREFRILALSATPGGDLKAVQQVMGNILISHIELRSEESIDIRPYTHERKVEKIVIPLGEELSGIRLKYIQRLIRNRVLYNREATKLSKFLLLKARDEFRQNPPQNIQKAQCGNIEADYAMAISLYHGFELLQLHGLRSLYNFLSGIVTGEKGYGRTRSELLRNADFNDVMEILRQKFLVSGDHGNSSVLGDNKIVVGHPKMLRLEEIVVAHFKSFQKNNDETRVMIFSQYRDSVQEIATILNQHQPLIKAMPFIGQSSAGKTAKGYTQKEQLMVMRRFRDGGYNTLVSTCVGEEGLDIGDVDLIVCFDAHKSPIRLVQRMGRTGRKRQGRIVMLVTEGKEEQIYNQSLYSKKSIHKAILNGARSFQFYPNNPRMVPPSVAPQCHKMHITLAPEISSSSKKEKTSRKSKAMLDSKSRKISDVFGNKVKRVAEDEYLTAAEYDEIRKEFAEVPSIAKHLPRPKCISLSSHSESLQDKSTASTSQMIDFAEWMPWQNRLQNTHLTGHSIQSIHLVKITEFIQLQQCIGEEDDHYGLEMSRILNEKDLDNITEHVDKQSSIRSFLTAVNETSEMEQIGRPQLESSMKTCDTIYSSGQKKRKDQHKSGIRKKVPAQTNTEFILIGSDSSLDGKMEEGAAKIENVKPKSSKLFTELGDNNRKSKSHNPDPAKKGFGKRRKTECNKAGSLSSKQAAKRKAEPLKTIRSSGFVRGAKSERAKIKRKLALEHTECIFFNISDAEDNDDFEVGYPARRRNETSLINIVKVNVVSQGVQGSSDVVVDNGTLDEHLIVEDNRFGSLACEGLLKYSDRNAQKHAINKYNTSRCADKDIETPYIPKPPPVSGVKELFQGLKSRMDFAELDLEELMEEWKRSDMELGEAVAVASPHKHVVSVKKSSDLKLTCINPDISDNASSVAEKVEQNISKSPLFKSLTSKSVQENDRSLLRKSDLFEVRENKKIVKVSDSRRSKDSSGNRQAVVRKSGLFEETGNEEIVNAFRVADNKVVKDFGYNKSGNNQSLTEVKGNEVIKCTSETDFNIPDIRNDKSGCKQSQVMNFGSCEVTGNDKTVKTLTEADDGLSKDFKHDRRGVKQSLALKFGSSVVKEIEEIEEIFIESNDGLSKDSRIDKSSAKNHTHNSKISPHQRELPKSFQNVKKTGSPTEYMNHAELSNFFNDRLDQIDLDISVNTGAQQKSSGMFHESFVTFTQAMDCLQTSSSEEIFKEFNISTPDISSSKCEIDFERSAIKVPSSHAKELRTESVKISHINQTNSFTAKVCMQDSADDFHQEVEGSCPRMKHRQDCLSLSLSKGLIESPGYKSDANDLVLPQFDLGFDFDDGDDDVIPPTPTKNLSPDSVFGLKTFTASRTLSLDAVTFSSSTTSDKASESARLHGRGTANKDESSSTFRMGMNQFEPLINNFDLELLSEEDGDEKQFENITEDSLQHHLFVSQLAVKHHNKEESVHKDSSYTPTVGLNKVCEKHQLIPSEARKSSFGVDFFLLHAENKQTVASQHSSPKRQKLPFDRYSPTFAKEHKTPTDNRRSLAEDGELQRDLSLGMEFPSKNSAKSTAGKLRLGKRKHNFNETIHQHSEFNMAGCSGTELKPSQFQSCKRVLDEASKYLSDFWTTDECSKDKSESTSKCYNLIKKKLSPEHALDPDCVSRKKRVSATAQTHVDTSPDARDNSGSVPMVKASTPLCGTPDGHILKAGVRSDGSMPELTPIRAHHGESNNDADDSFVVRRRKRIRFLDLSSDQDAEEGVAHVNADGIEKDKVSTLRQHDSFLLKEVEKSISDDEHISMLDGFDDDDVDDFEDNHNVTFQPKQSIKNKIQKNRKAAEFIEKEAEVSGDNASSDEHEEVDDFYESSFIDNNTEVTQTQSTDMKAIYLKSVRSPVLDRFAGRYKIQYSTKKQQDMDVFSQTLPEDHGMSEYEEDSFCVGSEEEDTSCLEEESQLTKQKQQKYSTHKTEQRKRGNKRIQVMSSSSSSDEKCTSIQMTQEFSIHPCKSRRRALNSSSEDEQVNRHSTLSSNVRSSNTRSLEKSCESFPQENSNTGTASFDRLKLTMIIDGKQACEKGMGFVKPAGSARQVLKNCQPVVGDVGNFDLLEKDDWFDDFDMPAVGSSSKNIKTSPLNKDNLQAKTSYTESKFLSLKNNTISHSKNSVENDLRLHRNSINYSHNEVTSSLNKYKAKASYTETECLSVENNTSAHGKKNSETNQSVYDNSVGMKNYDDFELKEDDASKRYPSGSSTTSVVPHPFCDSYKDLVVWNESADQLKSHNETNINLLHFVTHTSRISSHMDHDFCIADSTSSPAVDLLVTSNSNTNISKPTVAMTREERLLKQKEKQEAYRKKLKQVQQMNSTTRPPVGDIGTTSVIIPEAECVSENVDLPQVVCDPTARPSVDDSNAQDKGQTSPIFTKIMEKKKEHQLQILVDTREISGAQEIISALRLKHSIAVTARQLSGCDYILSNHLAADRIQMSTFSNSSHRSKLSSRLCEMQALYERCVLIVEADKVKAGQEKSKKLIHRTKYLDTTLSYLAQSKVKVYFTDSAEETSALLADLCHVEEVKGRALNIPVLLGSTKEEVLSFVLSVPGITVPQALNLAHKFRSIAELLSSSVPIIQEYGCMTSGTAEALHRFWRQQFDNQKSNNKS